MVKALHAWDMLEYIAHARTQGGGEMGKHLDT
jgi:hypothetical protein